MRTAALSISSLLLAAGALPDGTVSLSAGCEAKPGEITVCADTAPPQSPYRLPTPLRRTTPEFGSRAADSVSRERNALFDHDGGGSGLCSTVGPGGVNGCAFKDFKRGVNQRANARDPRGRLYETPR